MTVRLTALDEALMERLLAVAIADASPDEVIPPVEGPPGWTPTRQDFFRTFHRERFESPDTTMFAILREDTVVGMIRLSRLEPTLYETGMWLARSARGLGLAPAALALVLAEAGHRGAAAVRANTTAGNLAAQATLRRLGATLTSSGADVTAMVELGATKRPLA